MDLLKLIHWENSALYLDAIACVQAPNKDISKDGHRREDTTPLPEGGKLSLSSMRAKAASETKTEGNGQLAIAKVYHPNDHSITASISVWPCPGCSRNLDTT